MLHNSSSFLRTKDIKLIHTWWVPTVFYKQEAALKTSLLPSASFINPLFKISLHTAERQSISHLFSTPKSLDMNPNIGKTSILNI